MSCLAVVACGGRFEEREDGGSGGQLPQAGASVSGFAGAAPTPAGGSSGMAGHAGDGTAGAYLDPGCPALPPPPGVVECDPLESGISCPVGEGCYPYVQHPFGEGCGVATFGAMCVPAGSGEQGAFCGAGTSGCAPGHICIIGARSGRRCAELCLVDTANACPAGLICGETDLQGYGVCS